jgi:hypothetical protein
MVPGRSVRPVHEAGRLKQRGHDDSHQLHPWIASTPCNNDGLAFMHGRHPETYNYRPACARTGLATPRWPPLAVQEVYRSGVGVANDRRRRAMTKTPDPHEHHGGRLFYPQFKRPSDARRRCDCVRLSLSLSGGIAVDTNFLKTYAERCRSLAENADEFTKRRLLDLAAYYDKRVKAAGPSAATRSLITPVAARGRNRFV